MKFSLRKNKKNGFTLIEILLAVSITSVLLLTLVFFVRDIVEIEQKQHILRTVHEQGDRIMQHVIQHIHDAESIIEPNATGETGDELLISSLLADLDPVEITLSGGVMYIEKDGGGTVAMHNDEVTTSNLRFTNRTHSPGWDTVDIELTLQYNNLSTRDFYAYEKTWHGGSVIRYYEQ